MTEDVKAHFAITLNSIIDGPPVAEELSLIHAVPRPEVIKVEGFQCEETPRDRKSWLEDAFWEDFAVPLNPTLMVSPFIREDHDKKMTTKEVMEAAFLVPASVIDGPTIVEENKIWVERVWSEVEDKSGKLVGAEFCHGDEDWLVLWDRLGGADWQLPTRVEAIAERLTSCWKSGWFSRVFIQADHFEWQVMFTAQGSRIFGNPVA